LFDDPAQKGNSSRTLAAKDTAFRPPDEIIRIAVSLAMPHIGASDRALPKAVDHFLSREISPPLLEVAFVFGFIEHDGFAVHVPIEDGPPKIGHCRPVLNARMRDRRLRVVVKL